jgi:hypothetical protein
MWDWEFEVYHQELHPSMKRPEPFSMNLQLNGQNVVGTYRATSFTTQVKGSWSDKILTLRYISESSDDAVLSTVSRLNLHIDGDSMWGEGMVIAPGDTRIKMKFKLEGIRKR